MKLNSGEFQTIVEDGEFLISIKQESDFSYDGGHTFEDIQNTFCLNKKEAENLISELEHFIKSGK